MNSSHVEKPSSILEIHVGEIREGFEGLGCKIEHTNGQVITLPETGTVVTDEIDKVWFDTKGMVSRHSDTQVEKQGLITKRIYIKKLVVVTIWCRLGSFL